MKLSYRLEYKLGFCIGRVVQDFSELCQVRDNFLLSVIVPFISKRQASLVSVHTAFPSYLDN